MTAERIFAPLKTEHYENFRDGSKTWELRGATGAFAPEKLRIGKPVELRKGYNGPSLWGKVAGVKTFDSIEEIPEEIDHRKITTGKSRGEFVESARELLGKYDSFVAFRVDTEI